MEILNLVQGSIEWLKEKEDHFSASEAPAMMGESTYQKRDDLLKVKATKEVKPVDNSTQQLFDKGHAAEAAIRPHIEDLIGQELYPATGKKTIAGLPLLASFDGLTMAEDINFEHKLFNKLLFQNVQNEVLPIQYQIQCEQQMMISGAEKTIFVVSDGTPENMAYMWYEPSPELQAKIINGWTQFSYDLERYEGKPETVAPEAKAIMELPAINIVIDGQVKSSNLEVYQQNASAFIAAINTDLKTDEDFANAEKTVKFCGEAEKKLELVKAQALEQTADISKLFRTIDKISEEMRAKRLTLTKSVATEKSNIKLKIAMEAKNELDEHARGLNESLSGTYVAVASDFNAAMKGKKTVASLQSAANDEVARCKIEINQTAEKVRANLKVVDANQEYKFLFNDLSLIVYKDYDDFALLVGSRISTHKQQEAEKLEAERERIRKEEEQKAQDKIEETAKVAQEIIDDAVQKTNTAFSQKSIEDRSKAGESLRDNISPVTTPADQYEADIKDSLIENGIGKQTAVKVASLISNGLIKHVMIN